MDNLPEDHVNEAGSEGEVSPSKPIEEQGENVNLKRLSMESRESSDAGETPSKPVIAKPISRRHVTEDDSGKFYIFIL